MSEKFNQSESSFKMCRIRAEYCNRFHIEHDALIWQTNQGNILLTYANTKMYIIIDDSDRFDSSPYNHIEIKLDDGTATAIQLTEDLDHVADYLMANEYPIEYTPVPTLNTLEWYKNIELGKAALELQHLEDIIEAWEVDDE